MGNNIVQEIPPRGVFSFVDCEFSREMLRSAFEAVESVPNGWAALMPEPGHGGFMYSARPPGSVLRQIDSAIQQRYDGHSGSSYGYTMRSMQGIARLGWDDFVRLYRNRNEQAQPAQPAQPVQPAQPAQPGYPAHPAHSAKPVITDIPVFSSLVCEETDQICPICLEYLVLEQSNVFVVSDGSCDGSSTNPVKCGHKYHLGCIRTWINNKNTCPICRSDIKIIAPLSK